MDSQDKIIAAFSEMAPHYEKTVDSELSRLWGWRYEGFIDHLIATTTIKPDAAVLDVATGTAMIPLKINDLGKTRGRINGLDITMSMLSQARRKIITKGAVNIDLVCGDGTSLPYAKAAFDVVVCGLATHHMDVDRLLAELTRVLRQEGVLSIADVGSTAIWRMPGVKMILRLSAFIYFILRESLRRAWAEALSISNIRSGEDWFSMLSQLGYKDISIVQLKSRYFWIPKPFVIHANKP